MIYSPSGFEDFRAPFGTLPVSIARISLSELTNQALQGIGRFQAQVRSELYILTHIPWGMLSREAIQLSMNSLYFGQQGEAVLPLLPQATEQGHLLRRTTTQKAVTNLQRSFNTKGQLVDERGEFLIATPTENVHDITPLLHRAPLAFVRTGFKQTPGQVLYQRNMQ